MIEVLSILGVIALLYGRLINYGEVVDDTPAFDRRRTWKDAGKWWPPRRTIWKLHGSATVKSIKWDRVITIGIHALACLMVYFTFGRDKTSWMAAMLFAVHPVNNQVSCWLNGKRYGINTILVCLMWMLGAWGVVVWCLTPLFQISALPALFLYFWKGWGWPLLLLPIAYFIGWNKDGGFLPRWFRGRLKNVNSKVFVELSARKWIIYFKSFGFYVRQYLWPRNIFMWHSFLEEYGMTKEETEKSFKMDRDFYFGVLAFVSFIVLIILNRGNVAGFGLFWWVLFISVFCNFVTITQTIAERYTYLPGVGLMVAVAYYLDIPSFCLLVAWYASKMDAWMYIYRSMYFYLKHHMLLNPKSPRGWVFYTDHFIKTACLEKEAETEGSKAHRMMSLVNALVYLSQAIVHSPNNCRLHLSLSVVYLHMGNYFLSRTHLEKAKKNIVLDYEKPLMETITQIQAVIDEKSSTVKAMQSDS